MLRSLLVSGEVGDPIGSGSVWLLSVVVETLVRVGLGGRVGGPSAGPRESAAMMSCSDIASSRNQYCGDGELRETFHVSKQGGGG